MMYDTNRKNDVERVSRIEIEKLGSAKLDIPNVVSLLEGFGNRVRGCCHIEPHKLCFRVAPSYRKKSLARAATGVEYSFPREVVFAEERVQAIRDVPD